VLHGMSRLQRRKLLLVCRPHLKLLDQKRLPLGDVNMGAIALTNTLTPDANAIGAKDYDIEVPFDITKVPPAKVDNEDQRSFLTQIWCINQQWHLAGKHRVLYRELLGANHCTEAGMDSLRSLLGMDLWSALYPNARKVELVDTVPNQLKYNLREILQVIEKNLAKDKELMKAAQEATAKSFKEICGNAVSKRRLV